MFVSAINVQRHATNRLCSEPFHGSLHQGSGNASASLLQYDKYFVDEPD